MDRGVHLDDFLPALEYAVQQEWLEPLDGAFFRLTETGFAAVSSPAAAPPSPAQDGAPATGPVNVSSNGQSGGITAHTVNIVGGAPLGPPPVPPTPPKPSWWDSWWNRLGVGAGILVAVLTILDYYGIKPHTAEARQVADPPQFSQPQASPQPVKAKPARQLQRAPEQPGAQADVPAPTPHPKPPRHKHTAPMKQPPGQQDPQPQSPSTLPATQPQVSVSSQNQSGGITAGTVNIYGQKPQRHLDQQGTGFLTQHVPKSAKVTVTAVMGDGEAFAYAQEITDWMRGNGWTNVDGVNQAIFSGPVFGQGINPKPDGSFDIQIGNQR